MDQAAIDNMTAQRMVHYLITPYNQWEAARIGLLDDNGKLKREPKTSNETRYFNMFHILAIKLRDIMKTSGRGTNFVLPGTAGQFYLNNKSIPAGNFTNWTIANRSNLPILGAAYSSMKECVMLDDDELFESFFDKYLKFPIKKDLREMSLVLEDSESPGNVASQVVGIEQPLGMPIMNRYKKQNIKKTAMDKAISKLKGENVPA